MSLNYDGRAAMFECKATKASAAGLVILMCLLALTACTVERRKSDSELGLNQQQAAGRKVYDTHCDRCHEPYSSSGKQGPGLKGVFKKPFLSISGLPANDERIGEIILYGRSKMPSYRQAITAAGSGCMAALEVEKYLEDEGH